MEERVHLCDCALGPCQDEREEGAQREEVERSSVPDTVIVVTAGVMPASLQSEGEA